MAGRDSAKGIKNSGNSKVRRRGLVVVGAAVGAFAAAAAMATGSAAPAKADIDTLLDPIIQPLITSLSDAIAGFDPAAATDLTSWSDSLLSSLNSIDLGAALPSTAEPVASAALPASSDPTTGTYDIPITVQEGTEPTVQASIDGSADQTLLVDTGSSGLVIPSTDLSLTQLFDLGIPTGINESGYSGGVDYIYLEYNDATVDYGDGALDTTNTPIDVEILSWPTSFSSGSPLDFQQFLSDNDVTGILGIGDNTAGPTESPLEADGYEGVLVDVHNNELIVEPTAPTGGDTVSGAPISSLYESVNGGPPVEVSDDVDSGGVYGNIPSSLDSGVTPGTTISVYDNAAGTGTPLYTYTVTDTGGVDTAPTSTSGTSIDSGVEPYLVEPIYIDYTDDTMTFYPS
ncbi:PecA family PE domain-processing aspartic protease [Mycobacterium sp.]|uniref:PecA family PE domain-processing aspartic protease n=1 Tax=Mycobacterium sp. TaxID=1785 RepID=UPI003F9AFE61